MPENNVNILAEITGSDPKLKDEVVLIGTLFEKMLEPYAYLDVLAYVPERDMKINATVIATLVYQITKENLRLPREE